MLLAVSNQFGYAAGNADSEDLDLTPLVEPLAICLCVIGVVMLVVAVLGLLGTCCNSRPILAVVSLPNRIIKLPLHLITTAWTLKYVLIQLINSVAKLLPRFGL